LKATSLADNTLLSILAYLAGTNAIASIDSTASISALANTNPLAETNPLADTDTIVNTNPIVCAKVIRRLKTDISPISTNRGRCWLT
jgi:hypothetical protein